MCLEYASDSTYKIFKVFEIVAHVGGSYVTVVYNATLADGFTYVVAACSLRLITLSNFVVQFVNLRITESTLK